MAVEYSPTANKIPPSTPDSLTSAWLNTDQLPFNTSQNYSDDDEASVYPEIVSDDIDDGNIVEEKEGEDLFNDNFMDGYRRMRIDDPLDDEMDLDQIMADPRAAEIELDTKEARISQRKLPQLLRDQDTSDDFPMTDHTDDDPYDDEDEYAMYRVQGTLRDWVTRDEVRCFIRKKFLEFLLKYIDARSDYEYIEHIREINEMVSVNKCSLEVDYLRFLFMHPKIAIWLLEAPHPVLEVMEEVANELVFTGYPNYRNIHQKIYVRITNLPVYDNIRKIRQKHLNTMIRIGGIVTRRSEVLPQLLQVKYDCSKCGAILGPFVQNSYSEVKVGSCPECQSKGPFTVNIEQTIYRNYQKLTLQESPRNVPAGRQPSCMEVILLNDLIDCARPGEEIEVNGIYTNNFDLSLSLKTKNGVPVPATVVEANYVAKKQDLRSAYKLIQEDKEEIEKPNNK